MRGERRRGVELSGLYQGVDVEGKNSRGVERWDQQQGAEQMAEQQEKMMRGKFTLVDFRNTMGQLKKLGPLQSVMKMIPGMGKIAEMMGNEQIDP